MSPRKPRKIPDVLTEEEQASLLKQCNRRYRTGHRNLCILKVMLDAGLRVGETLNLWSKDVDWTTGRIKVVQGKGKKDRIVWLNQDCLDLLKTWKDRAKVEGGLLFTTVKNTAISNRYMGFAVKRYVLRAGITKNIHPHSLRHSFATDIYRETKNLRLVQKALGHNNISTTEIYTHIIDEEMEEAMKGFRKGKGPATEGSPA